MQYVIVSLLCKYRQQTLHCKDNIASLITVWVIQSGSCICKFGKKMRWLILLTFTAAVLSATGVKAGQNYTCPETNMQFGQDFIDEVVGVADWHGCGKELFSINQFVSC